jgi:hypothetical protein
MADQNPYEHQQALEDIYVLLASYHTQVCLCVGLGDALGGGVQAVAGA